MALCPSPLQYRHRLCCIRRVFSATDSGPWRQGWATERFIGSSPVVRTETHWVIVRGVAEIVIAEPHVHVTWGVTGDVLVVKARFCGVITRVWVLFVTSRVSAHQGFDRITSQSSVSQGALPECLKRCILTKILNYRRKKSARARRTKYLPVFTSVSAHVSRLSHPHSGSPPGLSHHFSLSKKLALVRD